MMKAILHKEAWLGKATVLTAGLAVTLALVAGVATTALAAVPGDPFRLGRTNTINTLSTLVGSTAGFMLKIDNNGSGPALDLRVGPSTTPPANKTVPPMKVDSQAQVVNLNSDELDGKDSTDFAKSYKRTVMVSPVPGNPTASGTALLDALASITGSTPQNPYLLKIEPGVYDLGNSPLLMKPYVDVEGSGEEVTRITRSGSPTFDTGTVVANKAELRYLTVENTGGATRATAIWNEGVSQLRLSHVTAKASGGTTNVGIDTLNASPRMTDITVTVEGGSGTNNFGVYNNNSSPTMTSIVATVSGGSLGYGVRNRDSSSPVLKDVTVTASNADDVVGVANSNSSPELVGVRIKASDGPSDNVGVDNFGSSPTMANVEVQASGGSRSYGMSSGLSSSPVIRDSNFEAKGAANQNRAIDARDAGTVSIDDSRLIAPDDATGSTLVSTADSTVQVGGSRLDGGPVNATGGTLTCAGVYDENYTFFANTCP